MDRWTGKVAVVTGASVGIGASIAEKLVKEGIQVIGFARRKEKIEELSKELEGEKGKLYALKVDITKEDEIVAAFKWIRDNVGLVHILVNNAGIIRSGDLIDGDYQKWREVFDTNVLGLCVATREAVKVMKENNIDGHIIHINAILGHEVLNIPGFNVYTASKFAVTALAETLRHELNNSKLKIKISNISPGATSTEILEAAGFVSLPDVLCVVPFLKSEDIADAVIYVLGTPPHVLVQQLTLRAVSEPVRKKSSE